MESITSRNLVGIVPHSWRKQKPGQSQLTEIARVVTVIISEVGDHMEGQHKGRERLHIKNAGFIS
jgi:hypothetical protein